MEQSDLFVVILVVGSPVLAILFFFIFAKKQKVETSEPEPENNPYSLHLKTRDGHLSILNPFRGISIIGGPGSGKSESIIKPIISQALAKEFTGLIYDWKYPELTNLAKEKMKGFKHVKFFQVAPHDVENSARINPLKNIPSPLVAKELATTLFYNLQPEAATKPDFFSRSAISVLSATIWFFHEMHNDICTLPHVVAFLLAHDMNEIVEIVSAEPEAEDLLASARSGLKSERQTAGVLSSLQENLSVLSDKNIFWVLSGDDVGSLELNNPNDRKVLALGNSQELARSLSPVLSLIVNAAIRLMNKPGLAKSFLLLDEAPTLNILDFEKLPATSRSNEIAVVYACQDISQSEQMYGETRTEAIFSNLNNQFYGRTTNPKTIKRVAELFGKYDHTFETKSTTENKTRTHGWGGNDSSGTSTGKSETIQERERVKAQDVVSASAGQFYALTVEGKKNEYLPASLLPMDGEASEGGEDLKQQSVQRPTTDQVKENYVSIRNQVRSLKSRRRETQKEIEPEQEQATHPKGKTTELER